MPPPNPPRTRPPTHDGYDSTGDYLSDDDLSPSDLNVLNTDYNAQRDFSFHPTIQRSQNDGYVPAPSDIRTRPRRRTVDTEKQEDEDWDRPLRLPPRISSKRDPRYQSDVHKHHDYLAHAYPSQQGRRPLIDHIKNEWAHTTSAPGANLSPVYDDEWEFTTPIWIKACFAPKFQRAIFVILFITFITWGNWYTWLGRRYDEVIALDWSVQQKQKNGEGLFGENMPPEFFDMVQLRTLDESLVPNEASDHRIIIIGDVHGCYNELMALLADCKYSASDDHLVFTGDLISKGPDSPAVVDLAIEANASCVRGNHEDRVLLAHRDMMTDPSDSLEPSNKNKNQTSKPAPGLTPAQGSTDLPETPVNEESFMHGDVSDRLLARQLTQRQLDWLAACPVILDVGEVEQLGNVHVAHAGLLPGVPLSHQDPVGSMTMRTIDLTTHVPSSSSKGVGWWKLWNKYQAASPTTARSTVVYGHDSKVGLNINRFSIGLDSGCVKGGQLSAFVIEGGAGLGGSKVVSVECQDYREMEEAIIAANGGDGASLDT